MCLEDFKLGRRMPDKTTSRRDVAAGSAMADIPDLVIPPNPFRVALRVFGYVELISANPEIPNTRSNGWCELWVDSPLGDNNPSTGSNPFSQLVCLLTAAEHTQLLFTGTEGMLLQRQMTIRVTNLDTFAAVEAWCFRGFSEYVLPEKSEWFESTGRLK